MSELTKDEAAWVKRLQRILAECPSDRIGAYTTGDSMITLYDRGKESAIEAALDGYKVDFCQAVDKCDAELGHLDFPFLVHSTAG